MQRLVSLIILTLLLAAFSSTRSNEIRPSWILAHMYDSIKNVKTVRQKVHAIERIEKTFSSNNSEIKVQVHPRKIYYRNSAKKLEVLYNSEIMAGKAFVKPHVFPYMTLTLDPTGNIMRRSQHYSIYELGYDFIGKSIALTINKDKEGLNNFTYHGKVNKNGYTCYMLEYENKSYSYTDYTVKEKETASLIAYRLCVNDYLLRYRNDLLNDFGFLKKGTVLKVPTLYCRRAILYIDEKLMLPVSISLYDDVGLFESYEYTFIEINKPFNVNEFSKNFPGYNF